MYGQDYSLIRVFVKRKLLQDFQGGDS